MEDKQPSFTKTLKTPPIDFVRGALFADRYEIIEELGQGGMGQVFRVEDKKTKEELALKLIKPEIAADKDTLERFSNELALAHKISHRNVCRMYHLGEAQGAHFITMEYIQGEDLKSFMKRSGRLAVAKTVSIAMEVCEGLVEAHRSGIIHRDLKPSNIMIDKEGGARIMDFGIARSYKAKGITGSGVVIGTPEYMSPEQAEAKGIDGRSDMYSLGVILYQMVTGQLPFTGDTPLSLAMKHKTETPEAPVKISGQIPGDLNDLILKCLAKEKEDRYPAVDQVLDDLRKIEQEIPVTPKESEKQKGMTSKEITVSFSPKRLIVPVAVIILVLVLGLVFWSPWEKPEAVGEVSANPSIAVLPFDDLSPDRDQGYLCEGFAVDIINTLTKIDNLRVPARTSSFSFRGRDVDLKEIGEKLKVTAVLQGTIQSVQNRVRITAELVSIEDESILWSSQFDREGDDIFAIQDEITEAIYTNLRIRIIDKEESGASKQPTKNLAAYNLYQQGQYHLERRTESDFEQAFKYYNEAIEMDPDFAMPYVGLAWYYTVRAGYGFANPIPAYQSAKREIQRALALDSGLAPAYQVLGTIHFEFDRDWDKAEEIFRKAISLNPGLADSHRIYAEFLSLMARHEEAIEEVKLAVSLDPLSALTNWMTGEDLRDAGKYDDALKYYKKAIEINPDFIPARNSIAFLHLQRGDSEKAISDLKEVVELSAGAVMYKSRLGYCHAVTGDREAATEILNDILAQSRQKYVPSSSVALVYAGLGEVEKAIDWLEKADEERDFRVLKILIDFRFDPLRSNPRFQTLLAKIGFKVN